MTKHLVEKTLQLMTVKQIAAVLKVSDRLVRKRVKELFPNKVQSGKTTYLTESEVTAVKLRIQENSSLATLHDRSKLVDMPKTNLEKKMIIQQAMFLINEEVETLREENKILQLENKDLQIELDEEQSWYSVKRIKNMGFLEDVNARKIWSPLKKWSIDNDYQIRSIFDANYGTIKTYHKDAWVNVYNIDFVPNTLEF